MTFEETLEQVIRHGRECRAAGLDWRSRSLPGCAGWRCWQFQPEAFPDTGVTFRVDTASVRGDELWFAVVDRRA